MTKEKFTRKKKRMLLDKKSHEKTDFQIQIAILRSTDKLETYIISCHLPFSDGYPVDVVFFLLTDF